LPRCVEFTSFIKSDIFASLILSPILIAIGSLVFTGGNLQNTYHAYVHSDRSCTHRPFAMTSWTSPKIMRNQRHNPTRTTKSAGKKKARKKIKLLEYEKSL